MSTKWSACAIAFAAMPDAPEPPGRPKWYAPKRSPMPSAPARFTGYVASTYVVPSVAFANVKRYDCPATAVQLMIPW